MLPEPNYEHEVSPTSVSQAFSFVSVFSFNVDGLKAVSAKSRPLLKSANDLKLPKLNLTHNIDVISRLADLMITWRYYAGE